MRAIARTALVGALVCCGAVLPNLLQVEPVAGVVLHYRVYGTVYRPDGTLLHRVHGERWARVTPPTLTMRTRWTPGPGDRAGGRGGAVESLVDARGTLVHDLQDGRWYYRAWVGVTPGAEGALVTDTIRREIGGPEDDDEHAAAGPVRVTPWRRQLERMGARWTMRCQRKVQMRAPRGRGWRLSESVVVWLDAQAGHVARKEIRQYDAQGVRLLAFSAAEGIGWGPAPPPKLLLTPPRGTTVWGGAGPDTVPHGAGRWRDLPEADRTAIEGRIARSEAAWVRADFGRFAAEWDFVRGGAPSGRPEPDRVSQEAWRALMAEEGGRRRALRSVPAWVSPAWTTPAASGQVPRQDLAVWVLSRWRCTDVPWDLAGYYPYRLHRSPAGWRIVDWGWRRPEGPPSAGG